MVGGASKDGLHTLMFKTFTTHLADSQPGLSVPIEKPAEYLRDIFITTNPGDKS